MTMEYRDVFDAINVLIKARYDTGKQLYELKQTMDEKSFDAFVKVLTEELGISNIQINIWIDQYLRMK